MSNKRRCTNVTSRVNSSESNYSNTYNSDNVIVNSNIPCTNVHTERSLNEIITLQKETDTESITSTNEENMDDKNASEELSFHQNSTGVIDHTCDYNGINLLNTDKEAGVTSIKYINGTNEIYIYDEDNFIHKYYAPFLSSNNYENVSSG